MKPEKAQMGENGRIVIPASYRKAMGLKGGENLTLSLDARGLHIQTQRQLIARAQAVVKELFGTDRSLSAELIAERRLEAKREEESG